MCRHSEPDQLGPVCINCHPIFQDAAAYMVIAFAALFILGQMVRSWEFFVKLAGFL